MLNPTRDNGPSWRYIAKITESRGGVPTRLDTSSAVWSVNGKEGGTLVAVVEDPVILKPTALIRDMG